MLKLFLILFILQPYPFFTFHIQHLQIFVDTSIPKYIIYLIIFINEKGTVELFKKIVYILILSA